MYKTYGLAAFIFVAFLGGCSNPNDDMSSVPPQQGRLLDDNVFSDQVKAIEKAEGMQQTLDAAAAKQREAIEKQERQ